MIYLKYFESPDFCGVEIHFSKVPRLIFFLNQLSHRATSSSGESTERTNKGSWSYLFPAIPTTGYPGWSTHQELLPLGSISNSNPRPGGEP